MKASHLESQFAFHVRAHGLPEPVAEFRFAPPRRWRFDFSWPAQKLAVEIEGGTWTGGRHSRGSGYQADCEKYNAAVLAGWRVLRMTGQDVTSGRAIEAVRQALRQCPVTETVYAVPLTRQDGARAICGRCRAVEPCGCRG